MVNQGWNPRVTEGTVILTGHLCLLTSELVRNAQVAGRKDSTHLHAAYNLWGHRWSSTMELLDDTMELFP